MGGGWRGGGYPMGENGLFGDIVARKVKKSSAVLCRRCWLHKASLDPAAYSGIFLKYSPKAKSHLAHTGRHPSILHTQDFLIPFSLFHLFIHFPQNSNRNFRRKSSRLGVTSLFSFRNRRRFSRRFGSRAGIAARLQPLRLACVEHEYS